MVYFHSFIFSLHYTRSIEVFDLNVGKISKQMDRLASPKKTKRCEESFLSTWLTVVGTRADTRSLMESTVSPLEAPIGLHCSVYQTISSTPIHWTWPYHLRFFFINLLQDVIGPQRVLDFFLFEMLLYYWHQQFTHSAEIQRKLLFRST